MRALVIVPRSPRPSLNKCVPRQTIALDEGDYHLVLGLAELGSRVAYLRVQLR